MKNFVSIGVEFRLSNVAGFDLTFSNVVQKSLVFCRTVVIRFLQWELPSLSQCLFSGIVVAHFLLVAWCCTNGFRCYLRLSGHFACHCDIGVPFPRRWR